MEIHASEKPILTIKEAIVHLAIVTAGILIALSLEGALEWRNHRALVREARANIAAEMRDNRKNLDNVRNHLDEMLTKLTAASATVDALSAHWDADKARLLFGTPGPAYIINGYRTAPLTSASHATAQATGALAYMEYAEVKKYAEAYNVQDLFLRQQTQASDNATTAAALGIALLGTPSPADVDAVKRQLRLAEGSLLFERDFANNLSRVYTRALGENKKPE